MPARRVASIDDFFDAALSLLVGQGPRSLKVAAICSELGVTTGSFYGHFAGLDAFVAQLLANRLSCQDRGLFELAQSVGEPEEVLAQLRRLLSAPPRSDETALRAWASHHAVAAQLQGRLDRERRSALSAILCKIVPSDQCRRVAEIGIALLVGYQHLYIDADGNDCASIFDEFEAMILRRYVTGQPLVEANQM